MVRLVRPATSALAIALFQAESVRAYGLRRNCQMSEWSPWEACGPDGYRTRFRSVVVPPSIGGSPCPATEAHEKCTADDWWMNGWGSWVCDSTTGMKSRTRTVAKRGRGGRRCPALVETAVCDPVPCVVNSASEDTGAWGACQWSSRSSQWIKSKVLGIKTPAKYSGICPPASDSSRRVTQVCPPVNCVVNSVAEDSGAWSECTDNGNGQWTKTKVLGIKSAAQHGGTCPATTSAVRQATEICPPVDCEVKTPSEDTGAWGACTTNSNGESTKTKVLGIKTPEQFGGSCPSVDDEARVAREPCAAIDCVVNSEAEDTGNWDPCQPDDESGQWFQKKVLGIKSPEQYGGSCPSDSKRTARKLCEAVDCELNSEDEDTGSWDSCQDNGSGQWLQSKVLGVKTPEQYGGSCPASTDPSRIATKLCPAVDCEINSVEEDTGTWDSCQDDGTGHWFQKKVLGVKTPEQFGGSCPSTSDQARIATQPCTPVDCVLNSEEEDTGTYDSCQDNGQGQWFQKKVLGVKIPEQFGGSCPSASDPRRIVSKLCPPVDCMVNSLTEDTGNWDSCQDNGQGQWFQKKVLGVKTPELNGGSCPSASDPQRVVSKLCPPVNCVVNTLAEDKGSWDACQDNGRGKWFQKKVLGVKTPEQYGGTCPPPTDPCRIATQLCPPVNCVIKTPAEDRGPYSTCSRGVKWESKYKVKVLAIKVPAMYGGTPCPPTSARLIKQYCGFLEYLDMLREYDAFVLSGGDTQIKEGLPFFTASQNGGGVSFGAMLPYNAVSSPKAITFTGPACGTGKRKLSVTLVCGSEVKLTPATRKSNCEWTTTLAMPVKEICPTFGPTL